MSRLLNPKDFIITRKRKKYRFALFSNSSLCYEVEEWQNNPKSDVLEMGAGTGIFSVMQAQQMPLLQYMAVDVKADRLQKGARLAEEKNINNVRFLRAYADQLADLIPKHSLQSIWVTFPDPFPKKRAAKRRLVHAHFLELYANLLKKDGVLYFKTDAHALFDWGLEQLVQAGWHIEELSFDLHESLLSEAYKITTTYETRFMSEDLPIYFVKGVPPRV